MRVGLAYAQARIGARLVRHPEAAVWAHLATARTVTAYLAAARRAPGAPWVATLDATATAHEIERAMRGEVQRAVAEVAGWVGVPWRPAVEWLRHLAVVELLPATVAGEAPAWVAGDPTLASYREGAAPLATLGLEAASSGGTPLAVWLDGWRDRWPDRSPTPIAAQLQGLGSPSLPEGREGEAVRVALLRLVRRHPAESVAPLAYLTLVVLDLARLRGELVARRLFEEGEG